MCILIRASSHWDSDLKQPWGKHVLELSGDLARRDSRGINMLSSVFLPLVFCHGLSGQTQPETKGQGSSLMQTIQVCLSTHRARWRVPLRGPVGESSKLSSPMKDWAPSSLVLCPIKSNKHFFREEQVQQVHALRCKKVHKSQSLSLEDRTRSQVHIQLLQSCPALCKPMHCSPL